MFNLLKIWWAQWGWQLKIVSVGVLLLIVILGVVFYKACNRPPKLNQAEIQKAQQAIAVADRKEMIEVLATSEAREKVADETIINANAATVNAIYESKKKWSEASTNEMTAELERRAKESQ